MEINIEELFSKIDTTNMDFKYAVSRGSGIEASRERMKNILFNRREEILEALGMYRKVNKDLEESKQLVESLNKALEEADEEYNELKRNYNNLKNGNKKEPKKKITQVPKDSDGD